MLNKIMFLFIIFLFSCESENTNNCPISNNCFLVSDPIDLTSNNLTDDQNPTWSPDGTQIAFTTMRSNSTLNIWKMNSDGSNQVPVVSKSGSDEVNLPGSSWCRLNNKIVFSSDIVGRDSIWIVNPDGTGLKRITTGTDWEPSWSPNCDRIVFQRRLSVWSLFIVNIDGTGLKQITFGTKNDWEPNWSPVNEQIVFQSKRTRYWSLWIVNSDGSGLKQLTNGKTSEDTDPSWSPDGNKILYSTDAGGDDGARIAYFDLNNLGIVNYIVRDNYYNGAPSWSPDGNKVVFESDRTGNLDIFVVNLY